MREMKDSGIKWIGKIPSDYKQTRLANALVGMRNGYVGPTRDILVDEGIPYIQSLHIKDGKVTFTEDFFVDEDWGKRHPKIHTDDILLVQTGEIGQMALVDKKYDGCNCHALIICSPDKAVVNPQYLLFYLLTYCGQNELFKYQTGVTLKHLNATKIKNAVIVVPPLEKQETISAFLSTKCAEIDSLIADIQSQIDTLEQYKRSVITEAVTKGLDKNVEMKESGLQWVGKMPAHWDIERIGSVYTLRTEKVSDEDYTPLSVTMQGIVPQLETAAKTNDHDNRKLVKEGDFVINSRSDRRGSCGISEYDGSVSLINTVLKPNEEMNPDYYNWLFHTPIFADEFYKWGHGIVDDLWTTGWEDMKKIYIPQPPLVEQALIAEYLDKKCKLVDEIISKKQEQLTTLDACKKATIYEYVTGKKEVPA